MARPGICATTEAICEAGRGDVLREGVGVLKREATNALRRDGQRKDGIWSQGCHMKSKREGKEFLIAFRYVRNHDKAGAVVFVWPEFREIQ